MAQINIDNGIAGDPQTGDTVYDALVKTETNFTDLYTNKADISSLADVATSGDYNDLTNVPSNGVSALTGIWQFNTNAGSVPGGTQVSTNTGVVATSTYLRFARVDKNNWDFKAVLMSQQTGNKIIAQQLANADNFASFTVSGNPTDNTTYIEIPITVDNTSGNSAGWQDIIFVFNIANSQNTSSPSAINRGTFNGSLALDNIVMSYYNNYDLSIRGPISFSTIGNTIGSVEYFRVISDGVTELCTVNNLNTIFDEQYGWLNGYSDLILPAGTWSIYICKTPTGVAISIPENGYTIPTPDTTIPVISLTGANPLELYEGQTYTDPGATASDNIDGDITSDIVVGGDTVDNNTAGTYIVTYDVQDAAGNDATQVTRTVNVLEDNVVPVITLIGNSTINVALNDTYTEQGATAIDNVDGDISGNIIIGGDTVNTAIEDTYIVTYNVSDSAGNAATEVTRTVNVVDQADVTPPATPIITNVILS